MDMQSDTDCSRHNCFNDDDDGDAACAAQNPDHHILKDVVAYVDVWSANENMSEVFRKELERLGATVVKRFSSRVTHVIFKEGNHHTITKAQKSGVHFLSVLWVDGCKQKNEHISETLFPAFTPKDTLNNPLFAAKRKRGKMMQPCDYEEDLARNAKRVARKQRRLDAINRLKSDNSTPTSSPLAAVLVQDTQPRSPDSEYRLTPIRFLIPETPPSMKEKMRQLRLAKQGTSASASATGETGPELDDEMRHEVLKPLQRTLFRAQDMQLGDSPSSSLECSPVFLPAQSEKTGGSSPNTSITDDILQIAENINSTLNQENSHHTSRLFGVDSDENLLSSQEIVHLTNGCNNGDPKTSTQIKADNVSSVSTSQECKEKKSGENRSAEQNVSKSRRKSRRLSVQQALQELNESSVISECLDKLDEVPAHSERKGIEGSNTLGPLTEVSEDVDTVNKISVLDICHENSSIVNRVGEVSDSSVGLSHSTSPPKRKRKSNAKTINKDSKDSGEKRSKSNSNVGLKDNDVNEINKNITEEIGDVEECKKNESSKQKKPRKKKLMSLTDLNDQHSVLVEPSKCSEDSGRVVLLETKATKRGRKKQNNPQNDDMSKHMKETKETEDEDVTLVSEKVNSTNKKQTSNKSVGKGRKKSGNKENVLNAPAVSLVNDTHVDMETSAAQERNGTPRNVSRFHDNTTHLNLTKDTSVSMDLRETTLSMSMSRAYSDNSMHSILTSNRKSIDEFSVSQRRKQRRQKQMKKYLASVTESDSVSTDSDNGVEGERVKVRGSTSQLEASAFRKNIRPSVVMTSLHSHEQDVVISVVKKLGGFVISENVNETTTHVICGEPRRTLNILQSLARGVWLLSKEWVLKSLEAGSWIEEGEFECSDLFPTCKVARQERENSSGLYRQTIFMGLGHIYVSGRSSPPRQQVVQLIKLCGGQVAGSKEKANVYVGAEYHPGLTCLKTNWILDCVSEHKLLPMDLYKLDRPKRESSPAY